MEAQELKLAKYFTAGLSFLLIALGGTLWPLTLWDMYATDDGYDLPTEVSRLEVHVTDSSGAQHILRPMDLYTLDDDTSNQTPGHRFMQKAIEGSADQQAVYRPYLVQQIESMLDIKIEQVEAWRHVWQVDFNQQPPIIIDQPAATILIDRFTASAMD